MDWCFVSLSRRRFLTGAGGTAAALAIGAGCSADSGPAGAAARPESTTVPFEGKHQAGVTTATQQRLLFIAFDVLPGTQPGDLSTLLQTWTTLARRLTQGQTAGNTAPADGAAPPDDNGEALGLGPNSLTMTFGFGRSLFVANDGTDRFGLEAKLPAALQDIPSFGSLDVLDPQRSDGDIGVQICCDDPQVAFHAMHHLAGTSKGVLTARWSQLGFGPSSSTSTKQTTPRNLMGFKDGTNNVKGEDRAVMTEAVWVGASDGPAWMTGGTYLVARRIRILLEVWDRASLTDQQTTFGRKKLNGAPLSGSTEFDDLDLDKKDPDGLPTIPLTAHVRLAHPTTSGVKLLRRGYNYTDGIDPVTGQLDSGLFFIAFQRNPATQFVELQQQLARVDALNEYIKHTTSALFAVPPGVTADGWIGQSMFE